MTSCNEGKRYSLLGLPLYRPRRTPSRSTALETDPARLVDRRGTHWGYRREVSPRSCSYNLPDASSELPSRGINFYERERAYLYARARSTRSRAYTYACAKLPHAKIFGFCLLQSPYGPCIRDCNFVNYVTYIFKYPV